jgi:hypothetical protein
VFLKIRRCSFCGPWRLGCPKIAPAHRIEIESFRRFVESATFANFGNVVPGVFTPVLAKHSKNFSITNALFIGWTT